MAGNGQAPFTSTWTSAAGSKAARGTQLLYPQINFGDTNAADGTLWDNWFFGSGTTTLAVSVGSFALSGKALSFLDKLNAAKGAFVLAGQAVTFSGGGTAAKPRNHPFFATPGQLMHR